MKQFEPDHSTVEPLAVTVRRWFPAVGALCGLAMILVGIYFAVQLFGAAYSAVTAPEPFGPVVDQWAQYLGGDQPVLEVGDEVQIGPRLLAILVLGGCTLVLLWITLAVIATGARIVYWMGTDLDAVKRVLSHLFGPSVINVVKGPDEEPPSDFGRLGPDAGD